MRLIVLICGLFLMVEPANAKPIAGDLTIGSEQTHSNAMRLDVMGLIAMRTVGGVGWLVVPVSPQGLVEGLNDSLDVELGGFAAWHSDGGNYLSVVPAVGAKWNFHMTRLLSMFVGVRAGLEIGIAEDIFRLSAGGSVGSYWHVGKGVDLRFEVGYPYLGMLGVSLPF